MPMFFVAADGEPEKKTISKKKALEEIMTKFQNDAEKDTRTLGALVQLYNYLIKKEGGKETLRRTDGNKLVDINNVSPGFCTNEIMKRIDKVGWRDIEKVYKYLSTHGVITASAKEIKFKETKRRGSVRS